MRKAVPALALLGLSGMAACSDLATDPGRVAAETGPRPGLNSTVGCGGKTAFETVPVGSDRAAIEQAAARARVVYLPAGTYRVNGAIRVPSCTQIYGDGDATVIIQEKAADNVEGNYAAGASVFNVVESGGAFGENVSIERMKLTASYTGTDPQRPWVGSTARAAVYVEGGRDITVDNLTVENLAILSASVLSPSTTRLNSYLRVHNSRASGYAGGWAAVDVKWVDSLTVANNVITGYHAGITAWGGDASPVNTWRTNYYQGRHTPLLARRVLIRDNRVDEVGFKRKKTDGTWEYDGVGIYTSMAEGGLIWRNQVFRCADLCLDAEGSKDITFSENHAGYATSIAMGFFWDSRNIKFVWNTVRQDDYYGGALFGHLGSHYSWCDARGCGRYSDDIQVHNNHFIWEGTGTGRLFKLQTSTFSFVNNTVERATLRFAEEKTYNGYMEVTGNQVHLRDRVARDRVNGTLADVPALEAGYNANNGLWVNGNTITSDVVQPKQGILVRQSWGSAVNNWIYDNRVKNFPSSIVYQAENNVCHTFDVRRNLATGSITNGTPAGYCRWEYLEGNQPYLPASSF